MKYDAKKLDLNKFKELFVKSKIQNEDFKVLSSDKASGIVFKISGFGTTNITGYEHSFLYLKKGSSILKHQHTSDVELYNVIKGYRIIDSKMCLLNDFHGFDCIDEDTIIETFKLDKKAITECYDDTTLNKCMIVQLDRLLWRLNKILNLLSLDKDDVSWKSFEEIAHLYNISVDAIETIYDIYFKNMKVLPYIPLSIDELKNELDQKNIPYVIDDIYKMYNFEEDKNKILVKK